MQNSFSKLSQTMAIDESEASLGAITFATAVLLAKDIIEESRILTLNVGSQFSDNVIENGPADLTLMT